MGLRVRLLEGDRIVDPETESLCEHGHYDLLVTGSGEPMVRLSDATLEPRSVRSVPGGWSARYDLDIDFYAGLATLAVTSGAESRLLPLDVAPAAGKLGRAAHGALLTELERWVEGIVFGATAADVDVGDEAEAAPPPQARYARLSSRFDQLAAAFALVRSSPHRAMVSRREERAIHRVRRADRGTIRSVLRRSGVRMALHGEDVRMATVDHPRREETLDTPANRHLKSVLLRLEAMADELARAFRREAEESGSRGETAEVRARAAHRGTECDRWASRLGRMRDALFLRGIQARAAGAGALLTVSWDPGYHRFERLARSILWPRLSLGGQGEALPLRRTYDLYELWCLATVEGTLRAILPALRWRARRPFADGALRLAVGSGICLSAAMSEGLELELWFQPTFSSFARGDWRRGRSSISTELRPDYALRLRDADGGTTRFLILDAKYRSGRAAIHDALRSAHIYRDALRWDGLRPGGVYLLCPALGEGAEAYGATEYHEGFDLGAVVLRPDRGTGDLETVLRRWLSSAPDHEESNR